MNDLYAVLGLAMDATLTEIKRAYRSLSKKLHPDAGGSEEAFKEVLTAYNVLSDTISRAHYDATGALNDGSVLHDEVKIFECVNRAFAKVLTIDKDYLATDLVEVMTLMVREELLPLQSELNLAERVLTRAKRLDGRLRLNGRLRLKDVGEDKIERLRKRQIANATDSQRSLQREIAVRTEAINLLKSYTFDPEEGRVGFTVVFGG